MSCLPGAVMGASSFVPLSPAGHHRCGGDKLCARWVSPAEAVQLVDLRTSAPPALSTESPGRLNLLAVARVPLVQNSETGSSWLPLERGGGGGVHLRAPESP